MSHGTNTQVMIFLYQIVLEIFGIMTGPQNIGQIDLHILRGNF